MIEIVNCHSPLNLDPLDFTKVIKGMNDAGYISVIWQSKIAMLASSGIDKLNEDILKWISYYRIDSKHSFVYQADIFVEGNEIIYILNTSSGFYSSDKRIEIGIITEKLNNAKNKLGQYVKAFSTALKSNLDGRRVRHMNQKWYTHNEKIQSKVAFEGSFAFSSLQEEELNSSLEISDSKKRNVLLKIAKAGRLKVKDIKGEDKAFQLGVINSLIESRLVSKGYTVTCRKNSTPLAVIQTLSEFEAKSSEQLSCVNCGRSFSDELLDETFALTALGRKLTTGSHWMTLLMTKELVANGIPEASIIWSLSDEGEEVDCVVEFKGKVWIFELKDRNFEAGDAHPFIYRALKYNADKIIVFTSERVSKEAKAVFEKVIYSGRTNFKPGHPLYIEGLDSLQNSISKLVKNETLMYVRDKSKEISKLASLDLSIVFTEAFGKYFPVYKGEFTEGYNIF